MWTTLTYDKNVVKTAIIAGIAAVSSVVLKVLLFPQYGAICLPVVNIVICSIMLFANYMLVSQAGYKKAVPFGKYGLFICIVLGVGLLSSFLYTHSMVRYGIVGIMAAVAVGTLILYRDALKRIIKKRETWLWIFKKKRRVLHAEFRCVSARFCLREIVARRA